MTIKRLSPEIKPGPVNYGFKFAFGFWFGSLLFFLVLLPAIACAVFILLAILGQSINQLVPH